MGNLHRQCGEFEEAITCYDSALRLDSRHWRSLLNKSVALIGLQKADDASESLKQAYALSGTKTHALWLCGGYLPIQGECPWISGALEGYGFFFEGCKRTRV